jgi:hypothetical protein
LRTLPEINRSYSLDNKAIDKIHILSKKILPKTQRFCKPTKPYLKEPVHLLNQSSIDDFGVKEYFKLDMMFINRKLIWSQNSQDENSSEGEKSLSSINLEEYSRSEKVLTEYVYLSPKLNE